MPKRVGLSPVSVFLPPFLGTATLIEMHIQA